MGALSERLTGDDRESLCVNVRDERLGPALTSIPGVDAGFLLLLAGLLVLTNLPGDMPDVRPRRAWGYAIGLAALLAIGVLFVGQPTPFLYFQF
jgi:hypothetical protein